LNVENASTAFVEKPFLYMSRPDWGLVSPGGLTPRFWGTENTGRTENINRSSELVFAIPGVKIYDRTLWLENWFFE